MATPTEIIAHFLSMWEKPEGFWGAMDQYFTDDTVWENIGMSKTTGKEEARAVFAGMGDNMDGMRVETLAIAAIGDKVLTERIDYIPAPDGSGAMPIRLMGIFEVKDGKIAAWRDYFDTAAFFAMMQPPQG